MNAASKNSFDGNLTIEGFASFDDSARVMTARTRQISGDEALEKIPYPRIKDAELQDDGSVKVIMNEGEDCIIPITKEHPKETLVLISKVRTIGYRI